MGMTPPSSAGTSPRGSPRTRRHPDDDDGPPGRRRNRSRDRGSEADSSSTPTEAPTDWEARTARLERQTQALYTEVTQLRAMINTMNGDHVQLNSLESALPERVHQCEARQASHIEILNGFARTVSEQIASLQHRMSQTENPPSFGGRGIPPAAPMPETGYASPQQRFDVGSPLTDPSGHRSEPGTTGMPAHQRP